MRLLRGRGISVPDDMSIVCFDDLGPYSEIEPFLTVAAQQAYQFGYMGMQMLIERIQERETALPWKKIVLPADLMIRRSVKKITPL